MDSWIVVLRGAEDALVEARAVLGSPLSWLESLQLFGLETADPGTAAKAVAMIAQTSGIAGAVALGGEDHDASRERALSLACAAADGEILFDKNTRARLDCELLFARPRVRAGWKLPVRAVALAESPSRRSECRTASASLPTRPTLVARQREIATLVRMAASPGTIALLAPLGAGAHRVLEEAAERAERKLFRVSEAALADGAVLGTILGALEETWIVVDPLRENAVDVVKSAASAIHASSRLVVRIVGDQAPAFVDAARTVSIGPLREFDAERLAQELLGAKTDTAVVENLARRGEYFPGRVVEAVRGATQLGILVRDGDGWRVRGRRVLRPRESARGLLARRVADLPELEREALRAVVALGDGAGRDEMIAAIRGTLSSRAVELFATLQGLGFVQTSGDQVRLSASLREAVPKGSDVVSVLFRAGAIQPAAGGEALLRAGRPRDAAASFARAARSALEGKLRAAAVRYLAAARSPNRQDRVAEDVKTVMRAVAEAIGPTVAVTREGGETESATRSRAIDPEYLEQTAAHLAERNDAEGASRLRALAEVVRGNSQRALRLSGSHSSEGSSRGQLVAALAQASAGELHLAIRSALTALAIARKAHERSGEAAALAVLSSLYKAAGQDVEARGLADSARKLQAPPPPPDPAGSAAAE